MGSVLVLYFFVLFLIVLHMGDSFHFCERVDNIEYISIYTISGEYMALVYVICICDILLVINKNKGI